MLLVTKKKGALAILYRLSPDRNPKAGKPMEKQVQNALSYRSSFGIQSSDALAPLRRKEELTQKQAHRDPQS
jgi:hypothetical protein